MRRLHCPQITTGPVTIRGPEAHHGRDVLRLSPGDALELFDGQGRCAPATVERIDRSQIVLQVLQVTTTEPDRPRITLATAIPKFAHQEELVRMTTQIGLSAFLPIVYRRSSVREQFRTEKWRRWTLEACKQCGANYLPEVHEAITFDELMQTSGRYDLLIVGQTRSTQLLDWPSRVRAAESVLILVGPEGGFVPEEVEAIEKNNALALSVGAHALRIETAAVVLCGIVRFLFQ